MALVHHLRHRPLRRLVALMIGWLALAYLLGGASTLAGVAFCLRHKTRHYGLNDPSDEAGA